MANVNDINYAQYTVYDHTGSIDQQATNDAINKAIAKRQGQFGTNDAGLLYDSNNADSYVDAMNQQAAWARDDLIRKEGYQREDTYYQRLFNDMRQAGINPAVVLSGLSGSNYSGVSSNSTFKASSIEERKHQKAQEQISNVLNGAKIAGAIAAIIGAIAMLA